MKNKLSILILCLTLFTCEKDDICEEGLAITPQVIVTFYDINNPTEKKEVEDLLIFGLDDINEPVGLANVTSTDSIAFPLRTNFDLTKIVFHNSYSIDDNDTPDNTDDDIVLGNQDLIEFNYTRQEVYISRACGYIYNYFDLNPALVTDTNNWILNIETSNSTIENETAPHVKIYH